MVKAKGANIILVNKDKRILLQLRDEKDWILFPGMWGLFGGHLKENEDPKKGLIREMKEETDIEIKNIKLLRQHHTSFDYDEHTFVGEINIDTDEVEVYEGQKGKLFTSEEAAKLNIVPDDLESIQIFEKSLL